MQQLSRSLSANLAQLKDSFGQSADFYSKQVQLYGCPCAILLFDGMASLSSLWTVLLDAASRHTPAAAQSKLEGEQVFALIFHQSDLPAESTPVADMADLVRRMTAGMAVLLMDGCDRGIAFSVQNLKFRSVGEPEGEGNLRGSREGFSDLLRINISLLRRLIRTETLTVETMICGERTATEVALVYDRSLAPEELVKQIRGRLSKAKLPVLFDSSYLVPFLQRGRFSFFQQAGYTERPATACAKLCEGKIIILVNGSPFAMIIPYFFSEHFQSLDDYSTKAYFASFIRMIKYSAFFLAVLLPGVFVSVAEYTPELFPPQLLYKIAAAEAATPLPLFLEMVLVIVLLEIVREAGLRLPHPIGHSVSLVAAIIVGDAAVKAGILSTPIVITAALTTISMFVIPSLYEPATVLRILFVFAGGLFGPFGILALLFIMLTSICGMNSFGLPYTAPLIPWGSGAVRDGVLRTNWKQLARHPFSVNDLPGGNADGTE